MATNYYKENEQYWKQLSDIDYFTQFVKAWLALNAWMRNSHPDIERDRDLIEYVKCNSNPVRNKVRSLFDGVSSESASFKALVADLHKQLEATYLETKKGMRVTFTNIPTKNRQTKIKENFNQCEYFAFVGYDSRHPKAVKVTVNYKKTTLFECIQTQFNSTELQEKAKQNNLSAVRVKQLLITYNKVSPRLIVNCTDISGLSKSEILDAGAYKFRDNKQELTEALIEVLYQMRNLLFHGELVPNKSANRVYDPAFSILKIMIEAI